MTVTVEKTDSVQLVMIKDRLDGVNASTVEGQLSGIVTPEDNRVVVDMSKLEYISSAGLRLILVLAKKVKQQDGKFVICGMQPNIREVFEISGFLSILTVVEDREAAVVAAT